MLFGWVPSRKHETARCRRAVWAWLRPRPARTLPVMKTILSSGAYPWMVDCRARGADFAASLEEILAALREAGVGGWEPFLPGADEAARLETSLRRHGLSLPSVYANLRLHEADAAEQALASVREAVPRLLRLGVRVVAVNPEPIAWGQPQDKNDTQLRMQAAHLERLARELRSAGLQLAYHSHDAEMRQGAREFHAMLALTDPEAVGLCLDAHWIYRGCGDSQIALEGILSLYGPRIRSVHLRQSAGGTWTETLGPGDVDYNPVVATLRAHGFAGPLVLEQAAEARTPLTMPMPERERRSAAWARATFGL